MKFKPFDFAVTLSLLIGASLASLNIGCADVHRPGVNEATELTRRDNLILFRNNPIHPRLVQEFIGSLADSEPVAASLDVSAAMPSNEFSEVPDVHGDLVTCEGNSAGDLGQFTYRRVGNLPNGTVVLWTEWNGGGTAYFDTLLLVRFRMDSAHDLNARNARPHLYMDFRGSLPLGDRDNGRVQISDGKFIIGHSRYRDKDLAIVPGGDN